MTSSLSQNRNVCHSKCAERLQALNKYTTVLLRTSTTSLRAFAYYNSTQHGNCAGLATAVPGELAACMRHLEVLSRGESRAAPPHNFIDEAQQHFSR
jgi:hypothetical protein